MKRQIRWVALATVIVASAVAAHAQSAASPTPGDSSWANFEMKSPTLQAAQGMEAGAKTGGEVYDGKKVLSKENGVGVLEEKDYEKTYTKEGHWGTGGHGESDRWYPAVKVTEKGKHQKVAIVDKAEFVASEKKKGLYWGGGIGIGLGLLLGILTANPFLGIAVALAGVVIGTSVAEYKAGKHEQTWERDVVTSKVETPIEAPKK
jgi:hypothetical protein